MGRWANYHKTLWLHSCRLCCVSIGSLMITETVQLPPVSYCTKWWLICILSRSGFYRCIWLSPLLLRMRACTGCGEGIIVLFNNDVEWCPGWHGWPQTYGRDHTHVIRALIKFMGLTARGGYKDMYATPPGAKKLSRDEGSTAAFSRPRLGLPVPWPCQAHLPACTLPCLRLPWQRQDPGAVRRTK